MKLATIQMGLVALALTLIGCASKSEPTASIFRFESFEPAVYYTAPSSLNDGWDGNVAIIAV